VVFTPEGRRPPLLTEEVFNTLEEVVTRAEREPPAGLVFLGEPGGDFQAGVDLTSMASVRTREEAWWATRRGQRLFQRVHELSCPTVTAIEGRCLGGGAELALACKARIAADDPDTAIAFPEVHIGILPGFGGTQRLPRLIGQRRALNMILTGQVARSGQALTWGLIDRVVPAGELEATAVALVAEIAEGRFHPGGPRLGWRPLELLFEGFGPGRRRMRKYYRKVARRRTGGHFPAPDKIIQAVGIAADGVPLEKGLEIEADLEADLLAGPVHKHLLQLMRHRQALRRPRAGTETAAGTVAPEAAGSEDAETVGAPAPDVASAAPFEPPDELLTALERALEEPPGARGAWVDPSDVPLVEFPGGAGLLRRLPVARGGGVVEVTWLPAAGAPPDFAETVRVLLTRLGVTAVWCYLAEPSPGLNLVAAYLREGDRLAATGVSPDGVDRELKRWGMAQGPRALGEKLAPGWHRRLGALPGRRVPDPATPGADARDRDEHPVRPDRPSDDLPVPDQMVAVLALEMARAWDTMDEPTVAGWTVLDVFMLGGPAFRGGVLGAARELGQDRVADILSMLAADWGPTYDPAPLLERGLLNSDGPAGREVFTDDDSPA